MEQYTSEQALNGILSIIETTINEYNQSKKNRETNQTSSLIEELLSGVGATASRGVDLGNSVKTLADGMSMLKSLGITTDDAQSVATMISTIGHSIASLEFNPASTDAVLSIAKSLAILGNINKDVAENISYIAEKLKPQYGLNISKFIKNMSLNDGGNITDAVEAIKTLSTIDKKSLENISEIGNVLTAELSKNITSFFKEFDVKDSVSTSSAALLNALKTFGEIDIDDAIKNIKKFEDIDVSVTDSIVKFINSIGKISDEAITDENVNQSINKLGTFVNQIITILNKTNTGFSTLFMPIKGKLLGKAIASFFNEVIKAVPKEKIEIEIEGLFSLMNSFYPLIAKDSKYSINKLLMILTRETGTQIGAFFSSILTELPKEKEFSNAINSIRLFLDFIKEFGLKDYIKLRNIITKENGAKIGDFFVAIINPLKGNKYPDLKPISEFLYTLSTIGIFGAMTLKMLTGVLTPKNGESISGFVKNLVSGLTKDLINRLNGFTTAMKTLSVGIAIMTGSIVLLAASIALFGALTVVGATVIAVMFVGSMILMLKTLQKNSVSIKGGAKSLKDISMALMLLTADVYLVAGAAVMLSLIDWESLSKVGAIMLVLAAFVTGAIFISNKWTKGGANAQKTMLGISAFLLASSVAVAIAVLVAKENSLGDILLGLGAVALVIIGTYFMINKLLADSNKKYDKALKNVLVSTAIIAGVALIANFLLAPLANKFGDVLIGAGVVFGIIAGISVMVYIINKKLKNSQVEQAAKSIGIMTAIFGAVSIIALTLLPGIGEKAREVTIGLIIVAVIMAGMYVILKGLSKISPKNLNAARDAVLAEALMLGVVSFIAAYLLIPIGEKAGATLKGFGVVALIIAALIGATYLLAKIKSKDLYAASIAIITISALVAVVSLVSLLLFIPIGEQAESIFWGGFVVLSIVAIMTLIIWGLSKIDPKNLLMASISLVAITVILLTVSLITKEILIPIGYEWKDAALGAVIVVVLIAVMAGGIALLSLIKESKAKSAALTMIAIAAVLFVVSYVVDKYLISIGQNAEDALYGSGIVVSLLLAMSGIIAIAGQMDLKTIGKGAAALIAVSGVLYIMGKLIPDYIDLCTKLYDNAEKVAWGSGGVLLLLGGWGAIMAGIGALVANPIVAGVMAAGAATLAVMFGVIYAISSSLDVYIDLIKKMKENDINASSFKEFTKMFLGNGNDKNGTSFIGSIKAVIEAFHEIGIFGSLRAGFIAKRLKPIFETIKMFIDIISNITSMKFVSEWDANGKPIAYETLTLAQFKEAGKTISIVFGTFLTQLGIGLKNIKDVSVGAILLLSKGIGPVMKSIKDFTSAILSVLSSKIPDEYDENGKPIKWRKFDAAEFSQAASLITDAFLVFLEKFSLKSKNISLKSVAVINMLKDGIGPLMNAVATWANLIMDFVAGKPVEQTDKNGNIVKTLVKIEPNKFKECGESVAESFVNFIEAIYTKFSEYGYSASLITDKQNNHIVDIIDGLKNVGNLMDAVEKFVNLIFKVAENTSKIDLKTSGIKLGNAFSSFIKNICSVFVSEAELNELGDDYEFEDTIMGKKLSAAIKGLDKSKKMVNTFGDVIGKLADCIKKYDGKITKEQIDGLFNRLNDFATNENIDNIINFGETVDFTSVNKVLKQMITVSKRLATIGKNLKNSEQIIKSCQTFVDALRIFSSEDSKKVFEELDIPTTIGLLLFLNKVSSSVKILSEMANLNELKESIETSITTFIGFLKQFENAPILDVHNVATLPKYMKYINKTIKQMELFSENIESVDVSRGITKFLKNIDLLTQPEISKNVASSQKSLISFQVDLNSFGNTIVKVEKKVVKFTTTVNKSFDALRRFDNAIINREKERNNALKEFGELLKNITDNMNSLNSEINNLDQNKIMSNFRGIATLFNMVLGKSENNQNNQTQSNSSNQQNTQNQNRNQQNTQQRSQQQQAPQIVTSRPSGRQVINVYFADTTLSGFAEYLE